MHILIYSWGRRVMRSWMVNFFNAMLCSQNPAFLSFGELSCRCETSSLFLNLHGISPRDWPNNRKKCCLTAAHLWLSTANWSLTLTELFVPLTTNYGRLYPWQMCLQRRRVVMTCSNWRGRTTVRPPPSPMSVTTAIVSMTTRACGPTWPAAVAVQDCLTCPTGTSGNISGFRTRLRVGLVD